MTPVRVCRTCINFTPLVWESTGGFHPSVEDTLKTWCRLAPEKDQGSTSKGSSTLRNLYTQISVCLQSSNASAILRRSVPPDLSPSECVGEVLAVGNLSVPSPPLLSGAVDRVVGAVVQWWEW